MHFPQVIIYILKKATILDNMTKTNCAFRIFWIILTQLLIAGCWFIFHPITEHFINRRIILELGQIDMTVKYFQHITREKDEVMSR